MTATRALLPDGRWHLQHGPIDLVIGADGEPGALARAAERLWARFQGLLAALVEELPRLRAEVTRCGELSGPVARRMRAAAWPHRAAFITPMAAVAGAIADELVAEFAREPGVSRAHVNDGGDVALHLREGERYRIGLFSDLARRFSASRAAATGLDGDFAVEAALPVRGVATSGWRGRSFSLGIADSVTVLARDAAAADAAATMVANAVNVADPRIVRRSASELADDTDLGDRLVTVDVPHLEPEMAEAALDAGVARAEEIVGEGLAWGAILALQGRFRVVGGCRPALAGAEGERT